MNIWKFEPRTSNKQWLVCASGDPSATSMRRGEEDIDESWLARLVDESRQRSGLDEMLKFCPGNLRSLLVRASYLTGLTARELVSDFPWPTRLRTLLLGGLMPSRGGVQHWKFREYDYWSAFHADFVNLQLGKRGFGYLYVGSEVPVFLVDLRLLMPLLGDLSEYLAASGCHECAVVSASLDAGFIVGIAETGQRDAASGDEAVFQLCTWGVADALNAKSETGNSPWS